MEHSTGNADFELKVETPPTNRHEERMLQVLDEHARGLDEAAEMIRTRGKAFVQFVLANARGRCTEYTLRNCREDCGSTFPALTITINNQHMRVEIYGVRPTYPQGDAAPPLDDDDKPF